MCGKTAILNAITAAGASSYDGARINRAVVDIPDRRLDNLVEMYNPLKTRAASLEVVDIPGLSSDGSGRPSRQIGDIKDVDALLHVVRCFEDGSIPFAYETIDPARDVEDVEFELMVADGATLESKIQRLTKRVRSGDEQAVSGRAPTVRRSTMPSSAVYRPGSRGSASKRSTAFANATSCH